MHVNGPLTIDEYEATISHAFSTAKEPDRIQRVYNSISDFVRENIRESDTIYEVSYSTDPNAGRYWGFWGYVVARDECVVHVSQMSYLN